MDLRAAKDAEEVEAVRRACAHIEDAYDELWADAEGRRRPRPRSTRASPTSSPAAARPTPSRTSCSARTPPKATVRRGSGPCRSATSIVADIAAQFDGYWGDLTRCAHAGPPSDWAARAWEVVHEAYVAAVAATRVGSTCRDVDDAQRDDHRGPPRGRRLPARRRPRDRDRGPRAAVPDRQLRRAAARGHDLHRRAGDLPLRARRNPARGRRARRARRPGAAVHAPARAARSGRGPSGALPFSRTRSARRDVSRTFLATCAA